MFSRKLVTYLLTYLPTNLVSQTICGKSTLFQTCITFDQKVYRTSNLVYIHNKGSRIELCYQFLAVELHSLTVMASFGSRFSVQHYKRKPFS